MQGVAVVPELGRTTSGLHSFSIYGGKLLRMPLEVSVFVRRILMTKHKINAAGTLTVIRATQFLLRSQRIPTNLLSFNSCIDVRSNDDIRFRNGFRSRTWSWDSAEGALPTHAEPKLTGKNQS